MAKNVKRILIAEDSPEWQRVHSALLSKYDKFDLDFVIVPSAADAIELLERNLENSYDMVITDLQMETDYHPQYAGEWLIQKIKSMSEYKNVPIVIVSATYNISFIAANLGVKYLSKRSLLNSADTYFFMLDENL